MSSKGLAFAYTLVSCLSVAYQYNSDMPFKLATGLTLMVFAFWASIFMFVTMLLERD
jgi:hypothetical protein